jgi:hypothetical protein
VKHCTDDELTLYYYGEGGRRAATARHLDDCPSCAALYREIASTLALIATPDVPERTDQFGLEVWQRIRRQLPEQDGPWWSALTRWLRWDRLALAGAAAVLVMAAFVAGRVWPRQTGGPSASATQTVSAGRAAEGARDRILLASVADHLDRSERVLTEIMNAPAPSNISTEQRWAEDLLRTSRLYRQDAIDAGEPSVAAVLDDLERNLLEIVHGPSTIDAADLEQIRRRIDAAALLFKVRVMSDELRQREEPPAVRALPRTSTRKVS